ncbi:TetR/AcrR family transcriptional regulator [Frigoribacterium sp. PvP032]|uniref:TetR/AcrR family transcriptional regulator n=1 Tax=Frigoribacterium sp. PvP032 TaxID=2806589 RepID=UPI001AEB8D84|nr:TetR/AcrR family transcriptional regulator [Frigoribacterium sp. PvP032]MBP1189861.1 AcrR family transcriptional regulator [Frigoribacterium sp. PvP032]
MTDPQDDDGSAVRTRPPGRPRQDSQALLDAAAAVFVESGVDAPVREIAARAGVGVGTVYRHFPTRPALVVAVYRHQVEACAEAGPRLLAERASPEAALREWVALFVDFLVTKHGLPGALHGDDAGSDALHTYFVGRLVPVCASLLEAARLHHGLDGDAPLDGYSLLRGVGNLCIGAATDPGYDADRLVQALVTGALGSGASSVSDVAP